MFGSIRKSRTFAALLKRKCFGRLAQLVQSICLTSRGSAVRIRQRPLLCNQALSEIKRAFSSAGSEHLPYKQRVGGSNPSTPTLSIKTLYIADGLEGKLPQGYFFICLLVISDRACKNFLLYVVLVRKKMYFCSPIIILDTTYET